MSNRNRRIFVADGNWYAHRAFHTVDPNIAGAAERLSYTVVSMICRDALAKKCKHLLVAFDGPNVFRYKLYRQYKTGRNEKVSYKTKRTGEAIAHSVPRDDLAPLMLPLLERLTSLGIPWVRPKTFEGDDVLGAVAKYYEARNKKKKRRTSTGDVKTTKSHNVKVILGIEDKDLYQVVSDTTEIYISTGTPRTVRAEEVEEKFGVPPHLMVDLQTMLGDGIDAVPSLGIPPKRVKSQLLEHGSLDAWIAASVGEEKDLFVKQSVQLDLNRRLVTMGHECYTPHLANLVVPKIDTARLDVPASFREYQDYVWPRSKGLF